MNTWLKILAGTGVGAGAFFLFTPRALATEDTSGTDVDPNRAKPQPTPPAPAAPGVSPPVETGRLGQRAAEVLFRLVGTKEEPPGSNRGPVIDEILRGLYNDAPKLIGKPWCARTVRYAYEKAAQELGLPKPFAALKSRLSFVTDWRDQFKRFYVKEPRTGVVALIIREGKRHATLVSRVEGDKVFTVEGNHADSIATVMRPKSGFDYFVDVEAYLASAAQTLTGTGTGTGLDLLGATSIG